MTVSAAEENKHSLDLLILTRFSGHEMIVSDTSLRCYLADGSWQR